MKLGIAMIPSAETINLLVKLQQEVAPLFPLVPLLGTEVNLPHVTLLQGRFTSSINWLDLISELRDYCQSKKYSLAFNLAGLEYQPLGWYFLQLKPNLIFFEAHKFVFERLKEQIFVTEEDGHKDTLGYTALERSNYFSYGYRYIGMAFHPHITFGRSVNKFPFANEEKLIDLVKSQVVDKEVNLQKITVYELSDNGSHAATLYSLNLKS